MKHGHGHEHTHDGDLIVRPEAYERKAAVEFLGQRKRAYDRLVTLAEIGSGDRVLDIGCGTGYLCRRAAAVTGPTGAVVGVDPSEPMVEYARRVSPAWCAYQKAPGDHVDAADASFDAVLSSLAIHHVPQDRQAATFAEMFRVLRPGGRLVIAEFRRPRSAPGRFAAGLVMPNVMRHHAMPDVPDLMSAAGFTVTGKGDLWPMLTYATARRPLS
jgi:ubiquinone/menaquinone biosynthesis C-methylase UbiE